MTGGSVARNGVWPSVVMAEQHSQCSLFIIPVSEMLVEIFFVEKGPAAKATDAPQP
jgi:hypothetical protein